MSAQISILLVEDDPGDARLALAVFQKLSMAEKAVVVEDAEEALSFFRSQGRFSQRANNLPALVLLDLGLRDQTCVVKNDGEMLDFLHARAAFRRRPPGLPAVVLLGPSLAWPKALHLLAQVRADPALPRMPLVMIVIAPDAQMLRGAYELGVNSVVQRAADAKVTAARYAEIASFWGFVNEPPPDCLRNPRSQRGVP